MNAYTNDANLPYQYSGFIAHNPMQEIPIHAPYQNQYYSPYHVPIMSNSGIPLNSVTQPHFMSPASIYPYQFQSNTQLNPQQFHSQSKMQNASN